MIKEGLSAVRRILLTMLLLCGVLFAASPIGVPSALGAEPALQSNAEGQCIEGTMLALSGLSYRARPLLTESVEALQNHSETDPNLLMFCGTILGMAQLGMGDVVTVAETFQMVADVAKANGDEEYAWLGRFGESTVYMQQGQYDTAVHTLQALLDQLDAREESFATVPPASVLEASMLKVFKIAALNNYGVVVAALVDRQNLALDPTDGPLESYTLAIDAFVDALTLIEETKQASELSLSTLLSDLAQENLNLDPFTALLLESLLRDLERQSLQSEDDRMARQLFTMLLPALMQPNDDLLAGLVDSMIVSTFDEMIRAIEPTIVLNLSNLYDRQGDRRNTERYLAEAERLLDETVVGPNFLLPVASVFANTNQANISMIRGSIAYSGAEYNDARRLFADAISRFEELGNDVMLAETYRNLGLTMDALGEKELALDAYERSMMLNDIVRAITDGSITQSIQQSQSQLQEENRPTGGQQVFILPGDVYGQSIALYAQDADTYADAFFTAERSNARLFADLIRNQRVLVSPDDERFVADLQQAYTEQRYTEIALEQAENLDPGDALWLSLMLTMVYQESVDYLRWFRQDVRQATARYESLQQQIDERGASLQSLIPNAETIITAEEVQAQLTGEDASLIAFYLLPDQVIAWVIDERGLRQAILPLDRGTLRTSVEEINAFIETYNPEDSLALREATTLLYDQLLRPLEALGLNEELILIPHNDLHQLPFAVLWDEETEEYLFEKHTLRYAPSATALRILQQNQNEDEGRVLVLGDPESNLNNVRKGLDIIAKQSENALAFLGEEATEEAFRANVGNADRIFVSTHASYNVSDSLRTSILLTPTLETDGRLEVSELFTLDLDEANLVVLAACQTDAGERSGSGEVVNLTRALLYAGTPTTVTTLWNVDEEASGQFLQWFAQNLTQSADMTKALQTTQQQIRQQEEWQHPYYWGAFMLTGASQ